MPPRSPMKSQRHRSCYVNVIKSLFDYCVTFLIFFPALILIFIIAIPLAFLNRGKIFFKQQRSGLNGKVFYAYKFRTMNDEVDASGNLLPDEARLTLTGKFIRKTSLDELPQILNVIKGDMSLVGPRPLLPEYLPYYTSIQRQRHTVKPGITGLAQINGRNETTWEKRLEYDIQYVKTVSFRLDLTILLKTIKKVLRSEGVSAEGSVTMPRFSDYIEAKRK